MNVPCLKLDIRVESKAKNETEAIRSTQIFFQFSRQSLTKTTSSTGKKGETPPPLPKRTASLPASAVKSAATADAVKSSDTKTKTGAPTNQVRFQMTRQKAKTLTEMTPSPCQSMTALRPRSCTFYEPSVRRSDAEAGATPPASPHKSFGVGHSLRKTVSFGEQLSGGNYLKMAQNSSRRPLSISHWPDGSTDIDAVGESTPTIDFEQKRGSFHCIHHSAVK